jgi:hypothetical protein
MIRLSLRPENKLSPPAKPPLSYPYHSPHPAQRRHDAPGGEAGRRARPENRPSASGRMRVTASVWCRYRASARCRRWSAGRRSVRAAGLANLSLRDARAPGWASQPHSGNRTDLAVTPRAMSERRANRPDRKGRQRGLANPWRLPALHSSPRGEGKQGRATRGPRQNGRRSVGCDVKSSFCREAP